jgi:hypothetical protein
MAAVTPSCPRGLLPTEGMFASTADLLRLSSLYVKQPRVPVAGRPIISERSALDASAGERAMASAFAPDMHQGMPWQVGRWSGRQILMHQSFGRGVSGNIMVDRETGLGWAILVNADSGESVCIDIAQALLSELFGVAVPGHPESDPTRRRSVERYAGTYLHDADHCYVVTAEGPDQLALRATDVYQLADRAQAPVPMRQMDEQRFAYQSGSVLFGTFDAAGVPHSLHFRNRFSRRVDAASTG